MNNHKISEELFRCYGAAAPRYTSYPSAAQFQDGFSSSGYESLLKDQTCKVPVSIYIHIPFCRMLCHYCGCFTRVVHDDNPIREYLDLLEKEITLAGNMTGRRFSASHIHFGGGSPNLLKTQDFEKLIATIDMNFKIQSGAEISMECDPRQMTADKTRGYALAGVNRVSLGVQDFTDRTQRAINRIQPFPQVAACTVWLRESGIKNINFDLIYGLPYQTPETVADNAFKAAALGADRIALFGYAHVPWMKPHQKKLEKHGLPGDSERYEQAEAARAVFVENGYLPIGMDHFALPGDSLAVALKEGRLHRNFQGYTTDDSQVIIGFGLSAISRLPEAYAQNTSSLNVYRDRLDKRQLPVEKGRRLSGEDRLRAAIIENLMCYFTVDAGEFCRAHGFPQSFIDESLLKIKNMKNDDLVEVDGRIVTVTKHGRHFVRSICTGFDAYFQDSGKHYARAV